MIIPSFLIPPKIALLCHIWQEGSIRVLHQIWQGCGYCLSDYRFFPFMRTNRWFIWEKIVLHALVILCYSGPLFWLYMRFDMLSFSRADCFVWLSWCVMTLLVIYRSLPYYCDLLFMQKIVIKATYHGYRYVGGMRQLDFKTLVFITQSGHHLYIKPYWPREQDIIAKFLSDAQVGHPVYIEKSGFGGLLLNLQSDWKALGIED